MRALKPIAATWRDAIRDTVLIVVSILLAFALQAWWDGKQEEARVRSVHSALIAEFEQNLDLLAAKGPNPRRSHEATVALLEQFAPGAPATDTASVRSFIVSSFAVNAGFRPAVGVSATLGPSEASEFLGDSLGIMLARWQRQMETIRAQGALLEAGVANIVAAWSAMGFPVSDFTPPAAGVPASEFGVDFREMLARPEVEALFASRAVELWQMAEHHGAAAVLAEEILELLRRAS